MESLVPPYCPSDLSGCRARFRLRKSVYKRRFSALCLAARWLHAAKTVRGSRAIETIRSLPHVATHMILFVYTIVYTASGAQP